MPRHFKVHDLVPTAELEQLEEFARDKSKTVDKCHDWLLTRGYTISRSAVGAWKREFDATDQFRASNELARSIMGEAKSQGAIATGDAAQLQISQMIFEKSLELQAGGDASTSDIRVLAMANRHNIQAKHHLEKLKIEIAEALNEGEKKAKGGASGEAVVKAVREALGIGA